jgi:hypothetical protein
MPRASADRAILTIRQCKAVMAHRGYYSDTELIDMLLQLLENREMAARQVS